MSSVVFEKNQLFYKLLFLKEYNQFLKLKTNPFGDDCHKNFAKINCAPLTSTEFTLTARRLILIKTPLSCFDSLFPISMVNERETNSCEIDRLSRLPEPTEKVDSGYIGRHCPTKIRSGLNCVIFVVSQLVVIALLYV